MRIKGFAALIAGLALVAAGLAAPASATPRWVKAESDHFIVFSDAAPKVASGYLLKLEQYRYLLASFYGLKEDDISDLPKLRLYFVNDQLDMKQAWPTIPLDVLGWYKTCFAGQAAVASYFDERVKSSQKLEDQTENYSQIVLFHEYAHTFMFQVTSTLYPSWFVEGFAEYWGTTRVGDGEALVGMAWQERVDRLITDGYGMPYDDLLRDRPALHADPTKADQFYAQSWLLTHWILSDADRRARFGAYVKAVNGGADPVAAFDSTMGVKVTDLEKTLRTYLLHDIRAQAYRLDGMPAPRITVTAMPASADKLMMWDEAMRTCPAKPTWPDLTRNVTAEAGRFPGDDFAQLALARMEIEIGDESQALPYLTAFTASHPDDAEAAYMLGEAWYLSAVHRRPIADETTASEMQKARTALGRAYTLDPLNAPTLYYFALAQRNPDGEPDDNTVSAAVEAHRLAPAVTEYALLAAELLVETGQMEDAKTMLYPLASNPHGGKGQDWAKAIIAAIDNGAGKADVLKLMHAPVGDADDS